MRIICFDVGGTKIAKAVVEINKNGKYKFLDYQKKLNPKKENKIKKLFLDYSTWAKREFKTNKTSVSSAGIVNPQKKELKNVKRHYGKEKFSLKFLEKAEFKVKTSNDGNCFALGEYFLIRSKPKVLLTLALGTGIGAGLIVNGKAYRGAHKSSMEVSHTTVVPNGRKCLCGDRGCWEMYAAGRGIAKSYEIFSGTKNKKNIFELARKGNKNAKKALKVAENHLVFGIHNLLNILDPDLIIFGGGIINNKDFMNRIIKRLKKENFHNKQAGKFTFKISKTEDKSNLLGAATLWR